MSWSVYKHVSPSGKVYIGISSNIKNRWALKGYYYNLSETFFSKALRKYGWDNFLHVILVEGLTKEDACALEIKLIAHYKALGMSYNITDGGEGFAGKHSEEHIKHRVASRVGNNNIDYLVIDRNFNYVICDTQKEVAELLNGKLNNISHVLKLPIGYTFRRHYIWKHEKGTDVDIYSIKTKIEEALRLRYLQMLNHMREVSDKMVENSKLERQMLSKDLRKSRYTSRGMSGKHHSETTRTKMSESARHRKVSKRNVLQKKGDYYDN